MAKDQSRSAKLKKRKKRKSDMGSPPRLTHIAKESDEKRASIGKSKVVLSSAKFANVASGKTIKKVEIKSVDENPASRDFKRMHIVTKGAIIETELGKARVTSRPSQDGVVNAVLVK